MFVAALLSGLVMLDNLATVEPGPGVLAFGAVVFLTMVADHDIRSAPLVGRCGSDRCLKTKPKAMLHTRTRRFAAAVYRKQPLRIIWLLPVIALLTAGWFLWGSLASRGPEITIRFETADGLEIGKSQIKHKDVVLGTIVGLKPVDGFKHVDVRARMNRLSENYLKKDTKFWIVRPQVSVEGITG